MSWLNTDGLTYLWSKIKSKIQQYFPLTGGTISGNVSILDSDHNGFKFCPDGHAQISYDDIQSGRIQFSDGNNALTIMPGISGQDKTIILNNIGTVKVGSRSSSDALSLTSGTQGTITSVSLSSGIWVLNARATIVSPVSGKAYQLRITSGSSDNSAGVNGFKIVVNGTNSQVLATSAIITCTANTSYNFKMMQSTGATKTAYGTLTAVRIV